MKIKCFFLTEGEKVSRAIDTNGAKSFFHVLLSPDNKRYHLGNVPVTLDNGEILEPAPVGAMWDGDWYKDCRFENGMDYNRNPDGLVLIVRTPGGDWVIDGPSFIDRKESGCWTRTGTVPDISASPSINIVGKYHGWLRDGYLEDC